MKKLLSLIAFVVTLLPALSFADTTRLEFPGGWYSDACTNRRYVSVIRGSHVMTPEGAIPLPDGGDPLQISADRNCARWTGTGWRDGNAWEWLGGVWNNRGAAFGNRANIYDRADQLVTVRSAGSFTGSIGWRYLDDFGALIASWQTYDPSTEMSRARGISNLWEWTEHGDIICGQGPGGLDCLIRGRRVRVEVGDTEFVNYKRDGNAIALATAKLAENSAVVIFTTAADLDALPTLALEPPAPTPTPVPKPTPVPTPVPPVQQRPDHRPEVENLARQFPYDRSTAEPIFNFVRRVAWSLRAEGVGLLQKPAGENIINYQGESYSISRVCYALHGGSLPAQGAHIFKILSDAGPGGTNGPQWIDEDKREDMKCLPALPPDDVAPTPTPTPSDDVKALKLRIGQLEMQIASLQGDIENLTHQRDTATAVVVSLTDEVSRQNVEIETLRKQVADQPKGCKGFIRLGGMRIPASCELVK